MPIHQYVQEEEMKLKQAQAERDTVGQVGASDYCNKEVRRTLTARFRGKLNKLQAEHDRVERLTELVALLDRYPDVARILDLIDEEGMRL